MYLCHHVKHCSFQWNYQKKPFDCHQHSGYCTCVSRFFFNCHSVSHFFSWLKYWFVWKKLTLMHCKQFENMLVLIIIYQSKRFSNLVPRNELEHFFECTIDFLGTLWPISKTLGQNVWILKIMKNAVFNTSNRNRFFFFNE